jgi:hypothetical protein
MHKWCEQNDHVSYEREEIIKLDIMPSVNQSGYHFILRQKEVSVFFTTLAL